VSASVEFKQFKTPKDLTQFIEDEVGRVRTMLGEYLRRLEEGRGRVERAKKTREALAKFAGSRDVMHGAPREIVVGGLKVTLNATPEQEQEVLEEVVRTLQDKLNSLQVVRKSIEPLTHLEETQGAIISVATIDNIPVKLLLSVQT
jgi:cysteinyl-tRNA synthetase